MGVTASPAAGAPSAPRRRQSFSVRDLGTFSSFQVPGFRLYFVAMVGQGAAMNMQMMAQSLLVYRVTNSATALGVMALANSVPMLVFSLFGGVLADRLKKKHIFIVGQAVSALLALGIGLSLAFGYVREGHPESFWILALASGVQGLLMGFIAPARQAFVVEVVGPDRTMNAISLGMLETNTLRLIAPAVAGFLVEGFGFQAIYFTMVAMYILAAVAVVPVQAITAVTAVRQKTLQSMMDGLRYVRRESTLLLVLAVTFFAILFSMPYMTLLPVFTEDILKVGAGGMGMLLSISGIGAMLCSIILASLPNKKRGLMMALGLVVLGLALAGFAFSRWWYVSLALIVFVGFGQTVRMSLGNTLLNYYVDPNYRGRIMSLMMMEWGLTSFGAFATAIVAGAIGVQLAVGGLAVMLVVMALGLLAFVPKMRRLD